MNHMRMYGFVPIYSQKFNYLSATRFHDNLSGIMNNVILCSEKALKNAIASETSYYVKDIVKYLIWDAPWYAVKLFTTQVQLEHSLRWVGVGVGSRWLIHCPKHVANKQSQRVKHPCRYPGFVCKCNKMELFDKKWNQAFARKVRR